MDMLQNNVTGRGGNPRFRSTAGGRRAVALCLSGALALGATLYSATPARAQVLDTDLDGLSDSYEMTLGTNPNNNDTDGDGFYDGIEDANPGKDGNPINPLLPDFRQVFYDFTNIQEAVNQNDSNHRLMPTYNPVNGLSFAYVVAASPGYTNPRIAIAVVGELDSETFITQPGDLPSPFTFHQIAYKADGSAVLYDDGKDIYEALANGGGVAPLTIMDATTSVFNPETVKIDGLDYIVASLSGDDTHKLVGWQYSTLPSNEGDVTTVVDLDISLGQEGYPRISYNSNILNLNIENSDGISSRNFITKGLKNIINNLDPPITVNSVAEPRNNISSFYLGNNLTGSIGSIGNFLLQSGDILNEYNTSIPEDFSSSDFEIYSSGINNLLDDSNRISTPNITVLPFPGNQPFASLDKPGTRLIMASDYNPFNPAKTEFSLLDMSIGTNVKVNDGLITGGDLEVIDPSGVTLTFASQDVIDIPDGEPARIKLSTPQIPLDDEARNIRLFEPSGTTFSDPGVRLTYPYRDEDILGLDELTLSLQFYSPVSGASVPIPTTIDAENNILEGFITAFPGGPAKGISATTGISIVGEELPGPSTIENWNLAE